MKRPLLSDSFWTHVNKTDSCWIWMACRNVSGYGGLTVNGARERAHRVSWMLHFGPIPKGMCVCHSCDNPPCVRPDHLFLGTYATNNKDMQRKGRARYNVNPRKGERHGHAKLSEADVLSIRGIYAIQRPSLRDLAAEYGVSSAAIYNAASGIHYSGTKPRRNAKLTISEVEAIRERLKAPRGMTLADLAERFGVAKKTIHQIVTRDTWRHI